MISREFSKLSEEYRARDDGVVLFDPMNAMKNHFCQKFPLMLHEPELYVRSRGLNKSNSEFHEF